MINIFVITRKEFFLIATVIILYINLDVLLQIIVGEKKMSRELLKKKFMKKILIISLCISLFIECSQVTLSIIIPNYARTFDTMDLLCNSISGLIGYMLYKFYNRIIVNSIET